MLPKKRSREPEDEAGSAVERDDGSKKAKVDKRENPFKTIPKGPKAEGGLAALKKKIRDAQRSLNRPNLAADVKIDLQRRLKALNIELEKKQSGDLELKLYEKYKYVRHVEKTKVLRKIKRAEKEDDAEELEKQKIDLAYIEHFPKDMKYLSLFPKENQSDKQEDSKEPSKRTAGALESDLLKQKIRERIHAAMESGEIEKPGFALREADIVAGKSKRAKAKGAKSILSSIAYYS
ncbi:18S rRNA maturation protein [Phlyctochytrium planicorne]|nr:18S rRNA maturation protein [Phlyctochytrium planicorne]